MPAATDLVHSLVFGELLVAKDAVETASRSGDGAGWSFGGKTVGAISGESVVDGGEGVGEGPFEPFPLLMSQLAEAPEPKAPTNTFDPSWSTGFWAAYVNLAPCFVTAATTPPLSLPFFLSFLEPVERC